MKRQWRTVVIWDRQPSQSVWTNTMTGVATGNRSAPIWSRFVASGSFTVSRFDCIPATTAVKSALWVSPLVLVRPHRSSAAYRGPSWPAQTAWHSGRRLVRRGRLQDIPAPLSDLRHESKPYSACRCDLRNRVEPGIPPVRKASATVQTTDLDTASDFRLPALPRCHASKH